MCDRIGATPLSEVPSLAAWRRAFRSFGVDPTTYRSAAEALLRRLTKQGSGHCHRLWDGGLCELRFPGTRSSNATGDARASVSG